MYLNGKVNGDGGPVGGVGVICYHDQRLQLHLVVCGLLYLLYVRHACKRTSLFKNGNLQCVTLWMLWFFVTLFPPSLLTYLITYLPFFLSPFCLMSLSPSQLVTRIGDRR